MEKSSLNKKLPVLPPCKVCGEQASGYHYGVNSCGACKGFFLRSLSRIEPYSCVTGGQCKVGPEIKRRKSCQKCRFDKCIRLGMSKNAIKIGRYTYSKRTQDTLELQQLQNPTSSTVQREDFQDSTSQTNHIADDTSILLKNVSPLDVSEVQTSASSNLQCEKNMSNFPTLLEENIFFNPKFPLFKSNLEIKSSCLKEIRHPGNELKETIFDQELDDQERESEMSPAQGGMQQSEARKHTTATNCTQTVSRNVTCSKYLNDAPNCMLNKEIFINETFSHPVRAGENKESMLDKILTCSNKLRSMEKQNKSYSYYSFQDLSKDGCLVINSFGAIIYPGNRRCLKNNCSVVQKIKHQKITSEFSGFTQVHSEIIGVKNKCIPWSLEFNENELDEWINHLVNYHKSHVFDNNSFDNAELKEKTDIVYNEHQLQETTFGELKALDRELYFEIYNLTGLDVDGRRILVSSFLHGIHNEISTVINFFKQIPGFINLPVSDQMLLVKGCSHEYQILGLYRGWDDKTRCMTFTPLGETLTEQDLRKVFPDDALCAHIQMGVTLQKLNLTFEQVVLLKAIVCTAPDRDELEQRDAVATINWKLVNCLLLLLWRQNKNPLQKFGQIMSVLTEMRKYSVLIRASYTNVRSDVEELTEKVNIPFIYELFF